MLLDLIYMICNVDCLEMQLLRFDGDFRNSCDAYA